MFFCQHTVVALLLMQHYSGYWFEGVLNIPCNRLEPEMLDSFASRFSDWTCLYWLICGLGISKTRIFVRPCGRQNVSQAWHPSHGRKMGRFLPWRRRISLSEIVLKTCPAWRCGARKGIDQNVSKNLVRPELGLSCACQRGCCLENQGNSYPHAKGGERFEGSPISAQKQTGIRS